MAEIEATFDFTSQTNSIDAEFVLYATAYYDFSDGFTVEGDKVKLAPATEDTIGGIIVGENLVIAPSGVLSVPDSSETTKGVARVATTEEVALGTDNSTIVTPLSLKKNLSFTFVQGVAQEEWIIEHNLNRVPAAIITDSAGNVIEGEEVVIDKNTIKLKFKGSFKGTAYLS